MYICIMNFFLNIWLNICLNKYKHVLNLSHLFAQRKIYTRKTKNGKYLNIGKIVMIEIIESISEVDLAFNNEIFEDITQIILQVTYVIVSEASNYSQ